VRLPWCRRRFFTEEQAVRTTIPFDDREVTQVFVTDCAITREEDQGLVATGSVEIVLRGVDGSASGPSITMGSNVYVTEETKVGELPALFIARAMELVKRVAREPVDALIAKETLPYEAKWAREDEAE
jgi:hypothetical protein